MLTHGLHRNVAERVYREDTGLNASVVKHGVGEGASVAAMNWVRANPDQDTPSKRLGTALHSLVLEPETFLDRHPIYREPKNKGEGSKTKWEAFQAAHAGKIILNEDQEAKLARMRDSIMDHPYARLLVTGNGDRECVAIWNSAGGLRCKARIDFLNTERRVLVDLKTTNDASERAWARSAAQFKYDVQAAWYMWGFWAAMEHQDCTMAFVVVENDGLHRCRVFTLPPDAINAAGRAIRELLPHWREAEKTGVYQDIPHNDPTEIVWPAWAVRTPGVVEVASEADIPF